MPVFVEFIATKLISLPNNFLNLDVVSCKVASDKRLPWSWSCVVMPFRRKTYF